MKRPVGVWIIFLYSLLSAIFTTGSFLLVLSGSFSHSPEVKRLMSAIGPLDYLMFLLSISIFIGGMVSLFRMKKSSFMWYAALAGANVLSFLSMCLTGRITGIGMGVFSVIAGLVIVGAILLYIRRLDSRKLLS